MSGRGNHHRTAASARETLRDVLVVIVTTGIERPVGFERGRDIRDAVFARELAGRQKRALIETRPVLDRTKDAADLYKELINKPTTTVSKVMAQMQLAALYASSQQPLEAKRIYEQMPPGDGEE